MTSTVQKGKNAEVQAANYLHSLNYTILGKNFYCRFGELDMICLDNCNNELVFVEVKSLNNERLLLIDQALSSRKLNRILHSINYWFLLHEQYIDYAFRLDYIGIVIGSCKSRLNKLKHYKNIGIFI